MKPGDIFKEFYGFDKKIRKLATKYASLIEVMCNETDEKNIEDIGDLRFEKKILEMGIKTTKKESKKKSVYRDIFFRRLGIDPEKIDLKKVIEKTQKEIERIEEKCRTIEILPRTKKSLLELSENMSVPVEELRNYIGKAEKDKVIEKIENGSYQLTINGLEVAYLSIVRKKHGKGKFYTLGKDF